MASVLMLNPPNLLRLHVKNAHSCGWGGNVVMLWEAGPIHSVTLSPCCVEGRECISCRARSWDSCHGDLLFHWTECLKCEDSA